MGVYYFATSNQTNGIKISASASKRPKQSGVEKVSLSEEDENKQSVNVFFGSQTGTAEEFSKIIAQEGKDTGLNMKVIDLEKFEPSMFCSSNSLFLVATYGEGEPTDNAKPFNEWLNTLADSDMVKGLRFAVFGLGNTQYEHYNSFAKELDAKLLDLGASRFMELGLGNDDDDIRGDFEQWSSKLWTSLREQLGLEQSGEAWVKHGVEYRLKYTEFSSHEAAVAAGTPGSSNTLDTNQPALQLPVAVNRELYESGDRSCRHLELDLGGQSASYETGDHIGIYANNDETMVEYLATRCNVDPQTWFTLSDESGVSPFPCPCTVREALTRFVDINGIPRKGLIAALSEYAKDAEEKARLVALTRTELHSDYHAFVSPSRAVMMLSSCYMYGRS